MKKQFSAAIGKENTDLKGHGSFQRQTPFSGPWLCAFHVAAGSFLALKAGCSLPCF